jgi:AcrR family transcriptional regulator
MRKLAARAGVSLRTPYELFGSKVGVIGEILLDDQAKFGQTTTELKSADELENLFDRISLGIDFYGDNQPFYRALFRATQAYTPGHNEEPARESLRSFQILSSRAQRAGLIRPEVDPSHLGETLTDIFASNVRTWARDSLDIPLVKVKISFGFAIALAGVTPEPVAARMRAHIVEFQGMIERFAAQAKAKGHIDAD